MKLRYLKIVHNTQHTPYTLDLCSRNRLIQMKPIFFSTNTNITRGWARMEEECKGNIKNKCNQKFMV